MPHMKRGKKSLNGVIPVLVLGLLFFISPSVSFGAYLTFVEVQQDGIGGVDGLDYARSLTTSPDGKHVYVASRYDDALAVFSRDAVTGALSFVEAQKDGVAGVDGLSFANCVRTSPDGKHVYVAGCDDHAVAVFSRNASTGALSFVEVLKDGVGGVDGLDGARSVACSPDGKNVYVAGGGDDALAVFSRNASTGELHFVEAQRNGINGVTGLDLAVSVTTSPDGKHVYVAGHDDNAVAVFSRNASTGALSFVGVQQDGVGGVDGLDGVISVMSSDDGKHVFTASYNDDAISVFSRDASTGVLRFVEAHKDDSQPGGLIDGLNGTQSVAGSPDGKHIYAAGSNDNAIVVFIRNAGTGALSFVEVQKNGVSGVTGLDFVRSVVSSPDNKNVYGAGSFTDTIAVFKTDPASASATHTLTIQKQGSGDGMVWTVPAGITCGDQCSAGFPSGTSVTLNALSDPGSAFDGWTGGGTCGNGEFSFTMDSAVTVKATFNIDSDGDGISDGVENNGPDSGDGNLNSTQDAFEGNVATFQTIHGDWVTLVSETGSALRRVTTRENPSPDDVPDGIFGCGFLSFEIRGLTPGAGTTAQLIMHATKEFGSYYKYGPTPSNPQSGWYEFDYNGETGAVLPELYEETPIILYLKDGSTGDADLQADGTIVDPGGPTTENVDSIQGSDLGCFIFTIK